MANLSEVLGSVRIEAKTAEAIKSVIELIHLTQSCDYFTEIGDDLVRKYNEGFCTEGPFYACGRWNYLNNIECMFRGEWLSERANHHNKIELLKMVEREDWKIEFDYVDEECGKLLQEMTVYVIHVAGAPINCCDITYEEFYNCEWP